jgi:SagB-type dehydrogenase family enzyme
MSSEFVLSFRPDVVLISTTENQKLLLQSCDRQLTFKNATPALKTALETLKNGGATPSQLKNIFQEKEGFLPTQIKVNKYLKKFADLGWLCYSILAENNQIAIAIPLASDFIINPEKLSSNITANQYIISRFAYCHQVAGETVLESPLFSGKIILNWQGAALVAALSKPQNINLQNINNILLQIPGISPEIVAQFISLLFACKMLSDVSENGNISEAENPTLSQWEFHDLLFHSRSRVGRHTNPSGGTFRFKGKIEPLPVVKPFISGDLINLYKPDLEQLKITDIPFTQVLENRKSIRHWGESPITAEQLGEFLYRSARIKEMFDSDYGGISTRPYPNGGAICELEIYPIIYHCQGLNVGLYHYRPDSHQLNYISEITPTVEMLLIDAAHSGVEGIPPILLVISARFQRLAWKYESLAYALMLKDLGCLYQTMYLVATAMNLAPCALGGGNSDLFVKAVGCDYYAETSVGEFVIGSCSFSS